MLTFLVNLSTCVIAIELFVSCPLSSATAAIQQSCAVQKNFVSTDCLRLPLELRLTTSELWFGQEQEGILP